MKTSSTSRLERNPSQERVALSYEEYYSREGLPTPFDPSVYSDDFTVQLKRDLLSETNSKIVEEIDVRYPHRDAVMRAVLEEVEFQIDHRSQHNEVRQQMLQEYLESGTVVPGELHDSILEKMCYGTHDSAEAGYILTSLPEDFDGIEVKKLTHFGMSLRDFHHEAYKTLGAFHRAIHDRPELGVTDIVCYQNAPEVYKEIPVAGAAPIGVFKQPLALCEQNGQVVELMTRGSYVTLPHRDKENEYKIISLQQYLRRCQPSSNTT